MRQPRLETSRLQLRPFTLGDWAAVSDLLADTESLRHMHFQTWAPSRRREWFAGIVHGETDSWEWIIETKYPLEVVGWCGIGGSPDPKTATDISFGYALEGV